MIPSVATAIHVGEPPAFCYVYKDNMMDLVHVSEQNMTH